MDYPRVYAGQVTLTPGTRRTTDLMLVALGDASPELIVEIAAGKGVTACDLSSRLGARVLAVDLMPEFLAEARRRSRNRGLGDPVGVVAAASPRR